MRLHFEGAVALVVLLTVLELIEKNVAIKELERILNEREVAILISISLSLMHEIEVYQTRTGLVSVAVLIGSLRILLYTTFLS